MIPIRVVAITDEHPDLSRRELHHVLRAAHRAMGVKWAVDLLPQHFGPSAASQFGYQPRTLAWKRRKDAEWLRGRAEGGADDDLVFRGTLRRQVLLSARFNISAFPSRVTIRMTGPAYFTLRPRKAHTARIAREILSMNASHERQIGEAGDRGFNAELRAVRAERRLRKTTRH
jgi:hypothetical protein